MKALIFATIVFVSVFSLHAERIVPVAFNFSATLYLQNTNIATKNGVTTTGQTVIYSLTQANLLKSLARAEFAKSNYFAPTFPVGAKLYLLVDLDAPEKNHFAVMGTDGALIVDVSDVLTFSGDGNSGTHKGGFSPATGTLVDATYAYMATIYYDDTSAPGGKMKYYLTGLYADKENDVVDTHANTFTRTIGLKSWCVSGSGTSGDLNLSGGGVASGAGSATLPLR